MKKVLIGICFLVGCGNATDPTFTAPGTFSRSFEGAGEFTGAGGAGGDDGTTAGCRVDADCEEGFVCKPYSGNCLPAPRPCEPGEVLVDLRQGEITDRNGVPYPFNDIDPFEVFTDRDDQETYSIGNKGHPIAIGWHHIMFEGGDPLHVNLEFHVGRFEIGDFEVEFGDDYYTSFTFECVFTVGELIAGDGEVECEQADGYRLYVTYDANTETCE
jgi:hypothetical protein